MINGIRCPNCGKFHEAHFHCKCSYPIYIKLDEKREKDKKEEVEYLKYKIKKLKEQLKEREQE